MLPCTATLRMLDAGTPRKLIWLSGLAVLVYGCGDTETPSAAGTTAVLALSRRSAAVRCPPRVAAHRPSAAAAAMTARTMDAGTRRTGDLLRSNNRAPEG